MMAPCCRPISPSLRLALCLCVFCFTPKRCCSADDTLTESVRDPSRLREPVLESRSRAHTLRETVPFDFIRWDPSKGLDWHDGEIRMADLMSSERYLARSHFGVPPVLHRSHKYGRKELLQADAAGLHTANLQRPGAGPPRRTRAALVRRNLEACARLNPQYLQVYYNDTQAEAAISGVIAKMRAGSDAEKGVSALLHDTWQKLSSPPLDQAFVLKSDLLRLAVVYEVGGWWLDADVACMEGVQQFEDSPQLAERLREAGLGSVSEGRGSGVWAVGSGVCFFAWEGELPAPPSAPLQWAFGCSERHPFLLRALQLLARRLLALDIHREEHARADPFGAKVTLPGGGARYVPVLSVTGPGMVGDALLAYAREGHPALPSLQALREAAGERADESGTWDRVTVVKGQRPVVVLPYCMFRSRGCAHLEAHWGDRTVFHHEFDTDWRMSGFHNYLVDHFEDAARPQQEL